MKDVSSPGRFQSLFPIHCRGSYLNFIVFDLTRRETFEECKKWLEHLYENQGPFHFTVVVGNKKDRPEREIDSKKIQVFCEENNLLYFETSAKDIVKLDEAFRICGRIAFEIIRKKRNM